MIVDLSEQELEFIAIGLRSLVHDLENDPTDNVEEVTFHILSAAEIKTLMEKLGIEEEPTYGVGD